MSRLSALALQSSNPRLLQALTVDGQMLEAISSAFAVYLKDNKFKIQSFSEEKGMLGVAGIDGKVYLFLNKASFIGSLFANLIQIVERFSSEIGDAAEGKGGIDANHTDMVSFANADDEGYQKVSAVIARYVRDIKSSTA